MNNTVTFVPAAARLRCELDVASLGTGLLAEPVFAPAGADRRAPMAPACIVTGAPRKQVQTAVPAMPALGQPGTTATSSHLNAIGAAAPRGSQTGSLPAWDPA